MVFYTIGLFIFMLVKNPCDIFFWKGEDKEIFFTYKIDDEAQLVSNAEFRIKPEGEDELIFNSDDEDIVTINEQTKKVRVLLPKENVSEFTWRRGEWALYVTEASSSRSFRLLYGGTKILSPYQNP